MQSFLFRRVALGRYAAAYRALRRAVPFLVPLAMVLGVIAWQLRLAAGFKVDDAFITFSFARNLATGAGPVYSHGLRVEGYSNFLWMVLCAVPLKLAPAADPYLLARVLTVPFAALLGWAVFSLVRLERSSAPLPRVVAWLALLLLFSTTDLIVAGVSGLETLPHAALLMAGFALHARGRDGALWARRLTVPCFVAVALMRIDGFVPLGLILGLELVTSIWERRFKARAYARWAAPSLAVYAAWFAWRYHYYGLPLPTTYYAKSQIASALPGHGAGYVRDFYLSTGLVALAPLVLAALLGPRRRQALPLALFVAVHSLYVVRVGGDWMPFFRFLIPVVPALVVLGFWGAADLGKQASRLGARGTWTALVASLVLFVWLGRRLDGHSLETPVEKEKIAAMGLFGPTIDDNMEPSARLLRWAVPPGARLVSDYAGVMAYYTDAAVIDMWGLCNTEIALRGTTQGINPIWGKTCPACYADLEPEMFHVRKIGAVAELKSTKAVVAQVWQSEAIGAYVDWKQFVAGRVRDVARRHALFFLEKRRPDARWVPRSPAPNIVVDYPFEPAARGPS